ncbi:hypothetical protein K3G63_03290 [Hymenobacter sp. HSC-4F20]|uniref:hypothetical protein n=1 Tax=Hymenobacter sp. HSC-4F20 TaxID=2864135 RepID=UPI001C72DE9A|nr:hypothetical protein [Hymenobacter sp. HSC-4F20]MBX0289443.1 hypothetical protein [Hymenobacter sp. HSC-4F20]
MNRLLPLLLLSLTLLTAACQKDEAQPASTPTLEGRWQYQTSDGYDYDKTGKVLAHKPYTFNSYYLLVTPDALRYMRPTTNDQFDIDIIQGRKGDTLELGPGSDARQAIITELTEHALTLRFYKWYVDPLDGSYGCLDDHYTR